MWDIKNKGLQYFGKGNDNAKQQRMLKQKGKIEQKQKLNKNWQFLSVFHFGCLYYCKIKINQILFMGYKSTRWNANHASTLSGKILSQFSF